MDNILPGKYVPEEDTLYSVLNGQTQVNGDIEIMDAHPDCQMVWVRFRQGDAIPDGAMKGDYLADTNTDLYIIKDKYPVDRWLFGYYDPKEKISRMDNGSPVTSIVVNMLVVL